MTSRRLARSVALAVLLAIPLLFPHRNPTPMTLKTAVLIPPIEYDRAVVPVDDLERIRQAIAPTTTTTEHVAPAAATRGTPRRHVAPPVTAPPAPAPKVVTAPSTGGAWACIREHESGGNYARNSGNGYYGAYQFSLTTWWSTMKRLGYTQYSRADLAPPAIQDQAAINLQSVAGWGQWPRTSRICRLR